VPWTTTLLFVPPSTAGITGVHHCPQPYVEMEFWELVPRLASNCDRNSASHVGLRHLTWVSAFPCLIAMAWTSSEDEGCWVSPDYWVKLFDLSSLSMMLIVGFPEMAFEEFSPISSLLSAAEWQRVLAFVQSLSCIYWDAYVLSSFI
jgi:hypothetical protein